jgi:AbrB family looped-hinge helix DNA binding protein
MKKLIKVTRNYRITIPAYAREKLGIKIGDLVSIEVRGDEIVIKKVVQEIPRIKLGRELNIDDINKLIEESCFWFS